MANPVRYPAVPLAAIELEETAKVTINQRTGASVAAVTGRTFASRPKAGRHRSLDDAFLDLRKELRRLPALPLLPAIARAIGRVERSVDCATARRDWPLPASPVRGSRRRWLPFTSPVPIGTVATSVD